MKVEYLQQGPLPGTTACCSFGGTFLPLVTGFCTCIWLYCTFTWFYFTVQYLYLALLHYIVLVLYSTLICITFTVLYCTIHYYITVQYLYLALLHYSSMHHFYCTLLYYAVLQCSRASARLWLVTQVGLIEIFKCQLTTQCCTVHQ